MITRAGAFGIHGDGVWRKTRQVKCFIDRNRYSMIIVYLSRRYALHWPGFMPSLLGWWP